MDKLNKTETGKKKLTGFYSDDQPGGDSADREIKQRWTTSTTTTQREEIEGENVAVTSPPCPLAVLQLD